MDWRIKLHRKLFDNPIGTNAEVIGIFVYLLSRANHKEKSFYVWYSKITVKPWQFVSSMRKMAVEFKMSKSKLYRIINVLETERIVGHEWNTKYTVFTILNWDKYQVVWTTSESSSGTQEGQKWDTDKNDNNEKKNTIGGKLPTSIKQLEKFIERRNSVKPFWLSKKWLPKNRKINKELKDVWIKRRKEYEYDEIVEWVSNYIWYVKQLKPKDENDDYYKHRFTIYEFLKQQNWLNKYFNS